MLTQGSGHSAPSPQHADLARVSAAKRGQGHAQIKKFHLLASMQ
ncbi:MAG: hypothetical protein RML38_02320 [Bacteroidia bacterium]|nr:hypothetical protein [Bacteroidia bacterium]